MNQNKLSTKFRQVRFKEETDNSIIEIAIRFGRTVPKKSTIEWKFLKEC